MRRYLAFAVACTATLACTSLLGTFQLDSDDGGTQGGTDAGPSDASGDATTSDAGSPSDSSAVDSSDSGSQITDASRDVQAPADASDASSTGGGDAAQDASDGGSTLRKLQCTAASATQRVAVTTGSSLHADNISAASFPGANDTVRVALVDYVAQGTNYTAVLRAYTVNVDQPSQSPAPITLALNTGQVFLIQRYGGAQTGFVCLFENFANGMSTLMVTRLPDSASAWTTPASIATIPNNLNQTSAVLYSVNASQDSYYAAATYVTTADPNTEQLAAGPVTASANPGVLPPLASYTLNPPTTDGYQIPSPGISMYQMNPYIFLSPNGANGPPPLGAAAMIAYPNTTPFHSSVTPPGSLNYIGYGMLTATNPLLTNLAILEADLNAIQLTYRVGQVSGASLASLDPTTLPATAPPGSDGGMAGFSDFIIANPSVKWEFAGLGDQLLMTAAPNDTNNTYPGVNFGWWDAAGTLRAYSAGSKALISDVYVHRVDATFATLVGSIADLWLAYEGTQTAPGNNNYPPPASDLWIAKVSCAP